MRLSEQNVSTSNVLVSFVDTTFTSTFYYFFNKCILFACDLLYGHSGNNTVRIVVTRDFTSSPTVHRG